MAQSPFVDYVKIFFQSGKGGPGAVSWRREKYVGKGGPEGGDGGKGGDIILVGDPQLWTLLDLKYRKHIKAEKGQPGSGARRKGKDGKSYIVKVPLGTVVKNDETGEIIGEIKEKDEELLLIKGGKGGLGNWHFRSSTRQTPEYSQPGQPETEMACILELKVLADVGLVGFPNAGKSTLLSVITAAKPKIGAYPFTTLVPNLGIVRYYDYQSFVMADIPGIIEGASEGKGLGTRFLRHIERNSILLFLVPADSEDIKKEFDVLKNELETYNKELKTKDMVLGISKSDLMEEDLTPYLKKNFPNIEWVIFSSATQTGLVELKEMLWKKLNPIGKVTN